MVSNSFSSSDWIHKLTEIQISKIDNGENIENQEFPEYYNYLINWEIWAYVHENIINGRIQIVNNSQRNPKSKGYLPTEAWDVLEYSGQLLCSNRSLNSLELCMKYVSECVWDNEIGREIAWWISTFMFSDAQMINQFGKKTQYPSNENLERYWQERKDLIETIQQKNKFISTERLEQMCIAELHCELMKLKLKD